MAAMGTPTQIANAILSLKPGADWDMNGTEYSGLYWARETVQTKPTEQSIIDEIATQ